MGPYGRGLMIPFRVALRGYVGRRLGFSVREIRMDLGCFVGILMLLEHKMKSMARLSTTKLVKF